MVIAEASAVSPEGRNQPLCPGLYDDNQIAPWKVITDFYKESRVPLAEYSLLTLDVKAQLIGQHQVLVRLATSEGGWETYSALIRRFLKGFCPPECWPLAKMPRIIADFCQWPR